MSDVDPAVEWLERNLVVSGIASAYGIEEG